MQKTDLISEVADNTGIPKKDAKRCIDSAIEIITDRLSDGDSVSIRGFGVFEARTRKARTGTDPNTLEKIEIPEKIVPVFRAGKVLRDTVRRVRF